MVEWLEMQRNGVKERFSQNCCKIWHKPALHRRSGENRRESGVTGMIIVL